MAQPEFGKIYEQIKSEPKIEFLVFYRGQHYFFMPILHLLLKTLSQNFHNDDLIFWDEVKLGIKTIFV